MGADVWNIYMTIPRLQSHKYIDTKPYKNENAKRLFRQRNKHKQYDDDERAARTFFCMMPSIYTSCYNYREGPEERQKCAQQQREEKKLCIAHKMACLEPININSYSPSSSLFKNIEEKVFKNNKKKHPDRLLHINYTCVFFFIFFIYENCSRKSNNQPTNQHQQQQKTNKKRSINIKYK